VPAKSNVAGALARSLGARMLRSSNPLFDGSIAVRCSRVTVRAARGGPSAQRATFGHGSGWPRTTSR
jgi:hypothetical protein